MKCNVPECKHKKHGNCVRYDHGIHCRQPQEARIADLKSQLTVSREQEAGLRETDKAYRFIVNTVNQYRGENEFNWDAEDMLEILISCCPDKDETVDDWVKQTTFSPAPSGWIKVEDALPEEMDEAVPFRSETVLTTDGQIFVVAEYWTRQRKWNFFTDQWPENVTHWMPITVPEGE